jgi:hypothetical protein
MKVFRNICKCGLVAGTAVIVVANAPLTIVGGSIIFIASSVGGLYSKFN